MLLPALRILELYHDSEPLHHLCGLDIHVGIGDSMHHPAVTVTPPSSFQRNLPRIQQLSVKIEAVMLDPEDKYLPGSARKRENAISMYTTKSVIDCFY